MQRSLTTLFLFLSICAFSQADEYKIELPEFLIGMFNDYNGKEFYLDQPKESTLITDFFCSESAIAYVFIDSLKKFAELKGAEFDYTDHKSVNIYSNELSKFFKIYYRVANSPTEYFMERLDSEDNYGIYPAKLKKRMFNSKSKKLSFLLGTSIRYGEFTNENNIKMAFANSPNSYKASLKYFQALNFKIVKKTPCQEGYIPCVNSFTVKVNEKYVSPFREVFDLKQSLKFKNDNCQ